MATETVILRPNRSISSSSAGSSYPIVELSQYWSLVAEEISDEDSTYYAPNKLTGDPKLLFELPPEEYLNKIPTKISVCLRMKETNGNQDVITSILIFSSEFTSGISLKSNIILTSSYQNFYVTIPNEYLLSFYQGLLNQNFYESYGTGNLGIMSTASSSSSKSTLDVRLTQLYLELEYSDGGDEPITSETIYLKQNGSWSAISGDIYKKENGIWVLKDASVLQQGLKYRINNV